MSNFNYKDSLSAAMEELAEDTRTVFLGQGVRCKGTFMSLTMENVPMEKRIELPVAENMQLGMSIGMALTGQIPVSIFPRWNFLLSATDQLVNHLDKMQPHVIVRVGIGSTKPLFPGNQHVGDFTEAFRQMMPNTPIIRLEKPENVIREYREAIKRDGPTILVEYADKY